MDLNEEPIVRTSYLQEAMNDPHNVRLANDSPLYHAFLEVPDSGFVQKEASRNARNVLEGYILEDPNAVLACQGKTAEEARDILSQLDV